MDIFNVLLNSFSSDTNARNASEAALKEMGQQDGYLPQLMHVINMPEVNEQGNEMQTFVRLAAAIQVKNVALDRWLESKMQKKQRLEDEAEGKWQANTNKTMSKSQRRRILSDQDKTQVKSLLLSTIVTQHDNRIRATLLELLFTVLIQDYPEKYASLPQDIGTVLQSSDVNAQTGALAALTQLFKRYRFISEETKRPHLYELVNLFFPPLLGCLQTCINSLKSESGDMNIVIMTELILQGFFYCNELECEPIFTSDLECKALTPWMEAFATILPLPINPQLPARYNEKLMAVKDEATKIVHHLFARFGRPSVMDDDKDKMFAGAFARAYTPLLCTQMLQLLQMNMQDGNKYAISDNMMHNIFRFLDLCVYNTDTFLGVMLPELDFIVNGAILHTVMLKQQDLEEAEYNPRDFILKSLSFEAGYSDHRNRAIQLLQTLLVKRTSSSIDIVLAMLQKNIVSDDATKVEAVLRLVGNCRKIFRGQSNLVKFAESILIERCLPLLEQGDNVPGFLKAQAVWLAGEMCSYPFAGFPQDQIFVGIINVCCKHLQHPTLNTKLQAALAVSRIIRVENERAFGHLKNYLPVILESFFSLVEILGSEDVVLALGTLLERLGEDVAPFAVEITQKLVGIFMQIQQTTDVDEDDEAAMTAIQCLKALNTILLALENHKELYIPIEEIVFPMCKHFMNPDGIEYFDDIIQILSTITYHGVKPSVKMWTEMLPIVLDGIQNYCLDYFNLWYHFLCNFISKDVDNVLLQADNGVYCQSIFSTVQHVLSIEDRDAEAQGACRLMQQLLAWKRGQCDDYAVVFIKLCVGIGRKLANREHEERQELLREGIEEDDEEFDLYKEALNFFIVDTMAACCYYNPALFLATLSSLSQDESELKFGVNYWFSHIEYLDGKRDSLIINSLALSALLTLEQNQIPAVVQAGFNNVVSLNLRALMMSLELQELDDDEKKNTTLQNKDKLRDQMWGEMGGGETEHTFGDSEITALEDIPANQDVFQHVDDMDPYLTKFTSDGMNDLGAMLALAEDEDVHVADPSPIDDVDRFIMFYEALGVFKSRNPQVVTQWEQDQVLGNEIMICLTEAQKRAQQKQTQ